MRDIGEPNLSPFLTNREGEFWGSSDVVEGIIERCVSDPAEARAARLALDSMRGVHAKTQREAVVDFRTGLANVRAEELYLERVAAEVMAVAVRGDRRGKEKPLRGVLILHTDLIDFGKFNKPATKGGEEDHALGDRILELWGEAVNESIRKGFGADFAVRSGGDETRIYYGIHGEDVDVKGLQNRKMAEVRDRFHAKLKKEGLPIVDFLYGASGWFAGSSVGIAEAKKFADAKRQELRPPEPLATGEPELPLLQ